MHLTSHPVLHTANVLGKGFGRVPAVDFRDRKYAIRLETPAQPIRGHRYWSAGPVLDQGDTPQCVAYSGQGFLSAGPVKNSPFADVQLLYKACQQADEWPGEDYDGTSVRGLMKVFKDAGYISVYNWAFDVESTVTQIIQHGPVVFGTDWYEGMFTLDAKGFVIADGSLAGGHAYLIIGANTEKRCPDGSLGAFRIQNSWGTDWGQHGRAWLSFSDAAKLIAAWGEVAIASEMKFLERPAQGVGEEEAPSVAPTQSSFGHSKE